MTRILFLLLTLVLAPAATAKPNVVLILADDLGYGDLGCYGQKKIRTPSLDRLAAQGMRFTQHYAGAPVCAPSRCCLMTGKHGGHAYIRDNKATKPEGQEPLPASEITLPELFKKHGYATAAMGKWGLGMFDTDGSPLKHGFDSFFGCYCQAHAHNHYPRFLYRDDKRFDLDGNDGGKTGKQFAHDLFEKEALAFVRAHKEKPFFLYLPFTIPHLALQVPEDSLAEYRGKWEDPPYPGGKGYLAHPAPRAAYAAMITRMDRTVGRLLDLLKELSLDDNTLVLFSSDNGPATAGYAGTDSLFFESAGPFRGYKGDVYEGGLRVPLLARWPGKIKAGAVSEHVCYFPDILPTLTELTGARKDLPRGIDGLSFAPVLLGKPDNQKQREYLVWEFHGYGGQQAVRMGHWKGVRRNLHKANLRWELYNLQEDVAETHDVAGKNPEILRGIEQIMKSERRPSKLFPIKILD